MYSTVYPESDNFSANSRHSVKLCETIEHSRYFFTDCQNPAVRRILFFSCSLQRLFFFFGQRIRRFSLKNRFCIHTRFFAPINPGQNESVLCCIQQGYRKTEIAAGIVKSVESNNSHLLYVFVTFHIQFFCTPTAGPAPSV